MPASPRTSSSRSARRTRSAPASYPVMARVAAEDATRDRRGRARHHRPAASSTSAGREGLLSARATAGKRSRRSRSSSPIPAPRRPRRSSCRAPRRAAGRSTFEPKTIDRIAPNENKEVQALITPAEQGDRRRLRHHRPRFGARRDRHRQTFRVTVTTSTHVGHRRRRHHRRRAADHGRRGGEVRPAMSETRHRGAGASPSATAACAVRRTASRSRSARGEIFGLLGPNGAGKTTTILMMLGLTDISAGEVRVLGLRSGARAARRSSAGSAICRTRSASTTT